MRNSSCFYAKKIFQSTLLLALLTLPFSLFAQTTAQEWLEAIDRDLNPPQYESYRKL